MFNETSLPAFLRRTSPVTSGKLDQASESYKALLAIWLIEMALFLGWCRVRSPRRQLTIFENDEFIALTGITLTIDRDDDGSLNFNSKTSRLELVRLLKARLATLRAKRLNCKLPLYANIELIGRLLGLSDSEKAVLMFATFLNCFSVVSSTISECCQSTSTKELAQIIAMLTGQPEDEIRIAMRDEGVLVASGIITVESNRCDLEGKLGLSANVAAIMLEAHPCEEQVVARFLKHAGRPALGLSDFPHLSCDVALLLEYLRESTLKGISGVNVLLYGPAGTGKTEFAKAIAGALSVELFEVDFADADGDPIRGEGRLRAFNLCQKLLSHRRNALLMFDEIEDVFESNTSIWKMLSGRETAASGGKAWINRTLERNSTPAIWITNDANIDEAYRRRFDYSIRFPIPPKAVRVTVARHHFQSFQPADGWLADIAANERTTPAQIERAAKVARIAAGDDSTKARMLIEQTLDRSATLLNQKRTPSSNRLQTGYDIRFINADCNVGLLVAALKRRPRGTFCFYGVPGSGKSELGRHIADQIGKPVLLRRASDLLSMWVGESEKNIANMFSEARQDQSVLVLDEADSFLGDRRNAQNSWEVTQVNELLTQMEAFDGIFICTTNLMQKLDQASLRRFACKVKFDFLTSDQRWAKFLQELARLGYQDVSMDEWENKVRQLEKLTPGDFAAVSSRLDLFGTSATAATLFEGLRCECAAKEGSSHRIGFTA